jgi:hypothetical protein
LERIRVTSTRPTKASPSVGAHCDPISKTGVCNTPLRTGAFTE